jgi:fumarate hydratase class II
MTSIRKETDSLGEVDVPADKLWGAQTQRSLEHFSIGKDLISREMIAAHAILKKGAANANFSGKRLDKKQHDLIVRVCEEILAGEHKDRFPLHVWMTRILESESDERQRSRRTNCFYPLPLPARDSREASRRGSVYS